MEGTLLSYCFALLVMMCVLMARSDLDMLRNEGRKRIILISCVMGALAYVAVVWAMEKHSFSFGDGPVWPKHMIVAALCLGVAVVAFAKQSGEHMFYGKFNSKWANVPLKIVTASIFLYLTYSVFCAAVLSLTWPFYKGVEPGTFFWGISIIIPGLIAVGILGLLAGILFWALSALMEKRKATDES